MWKKIRENERIRSLKNYQALYDYVTANKLVHLYLHNGCYMELYSKKRNDTSEAIHNRDDQMVMDIDVQKLDVDTQTEFLTDNTMNRFGTTTNCNAVLNTNPCQSFPMMTLNFIRSISDSSIELPFYRLPARHKTCSTCKKNFLFQKHFLPRN